jgi:hypothetical protein
MNESASIFKKSRLRLEGSPKTKEPANAGMNQ